MDLILWRHCDAAAGEPDLARELTAKGHAQAQHMAQWLSPRLPERCRIVVSPAVRTQQTAMTLRREFETSADIGPGAGVQTLLAIAHWPSSARPVLLVGHQPTLGALAALLMASSTRGWHVRKGSVWWLANRDGAMSATLKMMMSPDLA
ncbi:MAG TPA: histidine phosphatase family protein [Casimicrobiaceae bacterium]